MKHLKKIIALILFAVFANFKGYSQDSTKTVKRKIYKYSKGNLPGDVENRASIENGKVSKNITELEKPKIILPLIQAPAVKETYEIIEIKQ